MIKNITVKISLNICKLNYNFISKRFMLSSVAKNTTPLIPRTTPIMLNRAKHIRALKVKPKSAAAQDLASDETGKHPHKNLYHSRYSSYFNYRKCGIICTRIKNIFISKGTYNCNTCYIIFCIMLGLSARRFAQKTGLIMIRFIIGTFLTAFILYITYLFISWYTTNIEGSFTKTASLEAKLDFFNLCINQMIDKNRQINSDLAAFLEKAAPIVTSPTVKIINTPYNNIPTLALSIINEQISIHNTIMEQMATSFTNKSSFTINPLYIIGIITIITSGYILWNYVNLGNIVKKGLNFLSSTQEEVAKIAALSAKQSLESATLNQDITKMATINSKLIARIVKLEFNVERHTK